MPKCLLSFITPGDVLYSLTNVNALIVYGIKTQFIHSFKAFKYYATSKLNKKDTRENKFQTSNILM